MAVAKRATQWLVGDVNRAYNHDEKRKKKEREKNESNVDVYIRNRRVAVAKTSDVA